MLLLLRPPATLTMFAGAHERTSKSPPAMGWRSWYALGPKPTQAGMEAAAAAMVNRSHRDPVTGRPTSLLDLGYSRVALDGGWPLLGGGINGSYHDARGWPVINTTAFPDIKGMVSRCMHKYNGAVLCVRQNRERVALWAFCDMCKHTRCT